MDDPSCHFLFFVSDIFGYQLSFMFSNRPVVRFIKSEHGEEAPVAVLRTQCTGGELQGGSTSASATPISILGYAVKKSVERTVMGNWNRPTNQQ